MEHDPEGHERLQVHKCRRDVALEVGDAQAPVVAERADDPAPLEQRHVVLLAAVSTESTSVKRGGTRWGRRRRKCAHEAQVRGQARPETRHGKHFGIQGQDQGQVRAQKGPE